MAAVVVVHVWAVCYDLLPPILHCAPILSLLFVPPFLRVSTAWRCPLNQPLEPDPFVVELRISFYLLSLSCRLRHVK